MSLGAILLVLPSLRKLILSFPALLALSLVRPPHVNLPFHALSSCFAPLFADQISRTRTARPSASTTPTSRCLCRRPFSSGKRTTSRVSRPRSHGSPARESSISSTQAAESWNADPKPVAAANAEASPTWRFPSPSVRLRRLSCTRTTPRCAPLSLVDNNARSQRSLILHDKMAVDSLAPRPPAQAEPVELGRPLGVQEPA